MTIAAPGGKRYFARVGDSLFDAVIRGIRTDSVTFTLTAPGADPTAPKEIVRLMRELRKRRLRFLGIYHSHPNWMDTNEPSPKDIALAYYSEAIYFIVTPRPYATTPIRAFSIRDGRAMELEIQVLP